MTIKVPPEFFDTVHARSSEDLRELEQIVRKGEILGQSAEDLAAQIETIGWQKAFAEWYVEVSRDNDGNVTLYALDEAAEYAQRLEAWETARAEKRRLENIGAFIFLAPLALGIGMALIGNRPPYAVSPLVIDVAFAYHAASKGRSPWWGLL
ncbi:MAG TPA: hypothetical protein VKT78_04165, partial [Fimbriimonadaceae bacterium]|nr:hypothetical protein [Fimbriimonadaceae bacterium]